MHGVRKVATIMTVTNLLIGITSFMGPLVTKNEDRVINIRPGFLYGVFAMNWLHALLHLTFGLIGLPATRTLMASARYMRLHAIVFAFLSAVGVLVVRGSSRIHMVLGMALNLPANLVHITWALVGLRFARAEPPR